MILITTKYIQLNQNIITGSTKSLVHKDTITIDIPLYYLNQAMMHQTELL